MAALHQNAYIRRIVTEKHNSKNPKHWFLAVLQSTEELPPNPDYKNSVFYKFENKIIFEYNEKNGDFWIDYDEIWEIFESKYGLNYQQIRTLIKGMLEKHYKFKDLTPIRKWYN